MPNQDHSLDTDRLAVREEGFVRDLVSESVKVTQTITIGSGDSAYSLPVSLDGAQEDYVLKLIEEGGKLVLKFASP